MCIVRRTFSILDCERMFGVLTMLTTNMTIFSPMCVFLHAFNSVRGISVEFIFMFFFFDFILFFYFGLVYLALVYVCVYALFPASALFHLINFPFRLAAINIHSSFNACCLCFVQIEHPRNFISSVALLIN